MEKYYFDTDKPTKEENNTKLTLDILKDRLRNMDVMADITTNSNFRATVVVRKNVGTSMFLASVGDDHFWLRQNAVKIEDKGDVYKYHFIFD